MNLFELFVKIGVDDQASSNLEKITGKIGNGLKTAAKIGTAAISAASGAVVALTKNAVENYAQYEQLVGGVDTLFKGASQKLQGYAAEAYRTSGMSANEFMENATSFSASLISALGDDTEKAADYANRAMISMSDNANKMGTSLDSIVQTYQSLSRGNMAMLDNLKLGYGGTKAELQRLIKDAASYTDIQKEMGVTVDASSMSFDNIVNAIAVVQSKLGIAGATAQEAGSTIEGSINSMKAAWQNLLTGMADEEADFETLINNLVTTVAGDGTESNQGLIGNILPRIEVALGGVSDLIGQLFPVIMDKIPSIIESTLPKLTNSAVKIVESLINGISQNQGTLFDTAFGVVTTLITAISDMLPEIVILGAHTLTSLVSGLSDALPSLIETTSNLIPTIVQIISDNFPELVVSGVALIEQLVLGIAENIDAVINSIMSVIETIVYSLTDPWALNKILGAALVLITELAWGLMDAIPQLIDSVIMIVEGIVEFLLDPANMAMLIQTAIQLVIAIGTGLVGAIPKLITAVSKLVVNIASYFKDYDWGSLGRNLVEGFKRGISNAWRNLKNWFRSLFGDLIGIAKRILGIASPSKVFKKLGGFTAEGFGIGWEDEFANVNKELEKSLAFENLDPNIGINASVKSVKSTSSGTKSSGMFGGTVFSGLTININGAKYSDERELVEAIAERLQMMTERREAVYA